MPELEAGNLLIWAGAIALIGVFALGTMAWAYVGSGSRKGRFPAPLTLPDSLVADVPGGGAFQQGCVAFVAQDFEGAIAQFAAALSAQPNWAIAHHNLGRLQANLQKDREALPHFMRASDLYLEADDRAGYTQVLADLDVMRQTLTVSRAG